MIHALVYRVTVPDYMASLIQDEWRYNLVCYRNLPERDKGGEEASFLGRGLGLGRSAWDSGAPALSETWSLDSVLKAESSKEDSSNDTKTQIHAN